MVLSYFIGGIFLFFLSLYFPFSTLVLVSLLIFVLLKKRKLLAILFLIFGLIYPLLRGEGREPIKISGLIHAEGVFSSMESFSNKEYSYRFDLKKCFSNACPSEVILYLDKYIEPGTEAEISMRIWQRRYGLVPGIYSSNPYYVAIPLEMKIKEPSRNIRWYIESQRSKLNVLFERIFSKQSADFSKALITGSKDIDPSLRESFRKTGLAHLLTISGTHFGLLFFLFFMITKRLIFFLPYRLLHKLTTYMSINLISGIIVLPIITWYFLLSGMDIPAFRSFVMAVLFVLGLMIERNYYWLTGLLMAATIILFIKPSSFFDLSFMLSFSAVLFIGLWLEVFKRKAEDKDETLNRRFKKLFINTLFISLSATLGTLPLILYFFHYLSLSGILVNILITPFVCFIILPLLLFFSFFYLISGDILLTDLLEGLLSFTIRCVEVFASFKYSEIVILPFPLIILILLYLLLILFLMTRNRFRYIYLLCFILVITFLSTRRDRTPQITFLDVGQGDSAVIELTDGRVILVDTGRSGIETSAYLKYRGKKTIDVLIITHPHPDHTGGLRLLKDNFKIKEIWDNGLILYSEDLIKIPRQSLKRGDYLISNRYNFLILHPYKGFYAGKDRYSYENNSSLVVKIIINNFSALFTGDIEKDALEDLVHLGKILDSDILKVPHHGSRHSVNRKFLKLVSPDISVISAGEINPYGHPHPEMLASLRDSKVFTTSSYGTIKILLKDRLYVKLYKNFVLRKTKHPELEILNIKNIFRNF